MVDRENKIWKNRGKKEEELCSSLRFQNFITYVQGVIENWWSWFKQGNETMKLIFYSFKTFLQGLYLVAKGL